MLLKNRNTIIQNHKNQVELKARPFLKWAGGKGQLLQTFKNFYPPQLKEGKIERYFEPFLGSGAVFFDLNHQFQFKHAYLSDINDDLIIAWKVIQENVSRLVGELQGLQSKYILLQKEERDKFFYALRSEFNSFTSQEISGAKPQDRIKRTAQLIFLNRTCFNGLFRVNSKGIFNAPVGAYENPRICDEPNLLEVNLALKNATIRKSEYFEFIEEVKPGSFIYFDPPYRPISKTSSFKSYSRQSFNDNDQIELSKIFRLLDMKGAFIMLSNSDPKNVNPDDYFFDDLYNGFNIKRVPARRIINSNPEKRGNINEIIITNYEPVN